MPDSIGTAFVDVAFDPKQISSQLAGFGKGKLTSAFESLGGTWGLAIMGGVGAAVAGGVAVGKYLYDVGSQFDDMADTIRIATGKTGKELDALSKTAKQVGTDVPTSFEDAGKAVASVSTRLGLTGKPLRTVSDQIIELARLSGTDLSTALNSVTRMLGDAGLKGAEASQGIDKLWRASQATQVPVGRLADLMTKFGGPMRQLGFSFEEEAALLGKFEKEGVNTELVMGSMRIALGKLAKAGKDPVKGLRETMQAIRDTGDAGEANRKAIELFGARAGPDMAAAIREGRFSIDELVKTIGKGHDTVLQAGKDTADFSEQWQLFKNRVAVVLAPVAEQLFSAIGQGMAAINEYAPPVIKALKDELGPVIKELGPLFSDLGAIIEDLMPVWRVLADVVVASAKRIGETLKGLFEVIGGIVKLIRALIEGDWGGAWDAAKQIVDGFVRIFKAQLDYVKSLLDINLRVFGAAATALGNAIKAGVLAGLNGIGAAVSSIVSGVVGVVSGALNAAGNAAKSVGLAIKNGVIDGVTGVGAFLASTVAGLLDILRGIVSGASSAARAVGSAIKNGVQDGLTGVGAFVSSTVSGLVSLVSGVVVAAASAARGVGNAIKNGVVEGVTGVGGAVLGVIDGIAGIVRGIVGAVAGAARAVGNAIYDGIMGPLNNLVGAVESVLDRIRGLAGSVGGLVSKIPGLRSLPVPEPGGAAPTPLAGPAPAAAAGLLGVTATATPASSAYGAGTLYGRRSPFAALESSLRQAAAGATQAAAGPTLVRVFIGDEELRGIVRTEVGYADDQTARVILAGAR